VGGVCCELFMAKTREYCARGSYVGSWLRRSEKLWWRLRELTPKGSHFRRQAPIGPYFADFACHTTKLVIEIDGGQHGQATQFKHDVKRDAYLSRNGYRVLRFWNNDVRQNIEGVLSVICEALESR
jgi:very-short-patch-repair endonuclease